MRMVVVYLHGLWLGGGESLLLRRRLARALGAETCVFSYSSLRTGAIDNAARLAKYLQSIEADTLHLVAHSMGGVLLLKLFELSVAGGALAGAVERLPPGRVVLTGAPVRGSRSAARLVRLPLGRGLLGVSGADMLLVQREPRWPGSRELGVIAGNLGVGLGRLLGRIDAPNDGTVWLDETDLPGATAQLCLHVSHTGLVFSAQVATQAAAFLQNGRFEPASDATSHG